MSKYIVIGSRARTITVYDTSTYQPIKVLNTTGWVSVSTTTLDVIHTYFVLHAEIMLRFLMLRIHGLAVSFLGDKLHE